MESDRQQLIDSLTAHISLYNSKSKSESPIASTNPNPRSSILKWFRSLTPHQRQSHLTIVDHSFTRLLLQMQSKIHSHGHSLFIVLPDIPNLNHHPPLPSLCHRRSHGLLRRVADSGRAISESIILFSSKEGESFSHGGGIGYEDIDCVTVGREFVENVDSFVQATDEVSGGGFLRGEESGGGLGSDWVELDWLKGMGYYSLEAFVANRLELALRLAWLNCNNGKKRGGVKLKEKVGLAGLAANVYWRKKGCVDWWGKLDGETRHKFFRTFLGKAAKSLTAEILNRENCGLEDECGISNGGEPIGSNHFRRHKRSILALSPNTEPWSTLKPPSANEDLCILAHRFKSLIVLQGISTELLACQCSDYDEKRLFFSSLGSVGTISDCILRKLRSLLMVVSLDCTRLELLGEGSSSSSLKKVPEKLVSGSRKKKGKVRNRKRLLPVPRSLEDDPSLVKLAKDDGDKSPHCCNLDMIHSSKSASICQEKDLEIETPVSTVDMECIEGMVMVSGTVKSASRKNKKARKRLKNGGLAPEKVGVSQAESKTVSTPFDVSQGEVAQPHSRLIPENSIGAITGNGKPSLNSTCIFTRQSTGIVEDVVAASVEAITHTDLPCQSSDDEDRKEKTLNCNSVSSTPPALMPVVKADRVHSFKDINNKDLGHAIEVETKPGFSEGETKVAIQKEEIVLIRKRDIVGVHDGGFISSSGYPSYEWPSLAPAHIPYANSHLPAATDRLHLDVGYNWHNHYHRSFVQTMHQVRNPPIENDCSEILPRPLPMSLDWPPMVRSVSGLIPSVTCSYSSGYISRRQSFQQGFNAQSMQHSAMTSDDERMYSGDVIDSCDLTTSQELGDEYDSHWIAEDDFEVHAVSGMDYSQYFGGGVMYWDSSDHPVTSFSRPPSLSSDDSSWAWREADMNRNVDDMVAFSSSYITNGLTSPSAASFCSPFDPHGAAHQALGYVIPGTEVTGKVMHSSTMADVTEENVSSSLPTFPGDIEAKATDLLPYPILPPIIIPSMSRERSRSEFKRSHDHKSPCVPPSRREQPLIKRPPSPVVLCVPRAPRPPPPSPVSDSRKHRGFPTVRSGSSSPRHWGVRGWFHDGINFEESSVRVEGSEVVWPSSWRKKSLSARQLTQPLPGTLLQDRLIAISLARDQEHPDVAIPLQPPEPLNCATHKASLPLMHSLLHDEIDSFCKQVAVENMSRKPYINWAVKRVTRSLQVLWPRSRTNVFGSNATGLSLPTSDVDLVVSLPPVRNLEPIKEAGILEGRNGIKETCLQHAARYLANQEWVKNDSLKIVENTAIPIIMLVVEVPRDLIVSVASNVHLLKESIDVSGEQRKSFETDTTASESFASPNSLHINNDNGNDVKSVRIDISFKAPSHTGLQTTELVKELTEQFPAATPLALVLKQFLSDRSLDQSYSGGLSSYCLVLLIARFLQHEHHLGRSINQNFGGLLMDFLYFFGNVFDPRQMRISVQGSGIYINRERGYSIDPIYIDDPLFPANNVGRNCFRIHQCIKAFADAYSILEDQLTCLPETGESSGIFSCQLLPKIIPSVGFHRDSDL